TDERTGHGAEASGHACAGASLHDLLGAIDPSGRTGSPRRGTVRTRPGMRAHQGHFSRHRRVRPRGRREDEARAHGDDGLPHPATPTAVTDAATATPGVTAIIPRLGVVAPIYQRGLDAAGDMPIAPGYAVTHYQYSARAGRRGN